MKVALSVAGKFHTFDLARELEARDALECIFTAYPLFKLRNESLPRAKIKTFPIVHAPYMAFRSRERLGRKILQAWELIDRWSFDVSTSLRLPKCDVFVGLSSAALMSGRAAHLMGAKYVCDRGSTHIRHQDNILREEHKLWGMEYKGIDPRIIEREEKEYHEADCITIPSTFTAKTFTSNGISEDKVRKLPYGVNLKNFFPTSPPDRETFDILFAGSTSLRKGIPYLLQAFQAFRHPKKRLFIAGAHSERFLNRMRTLGLWSDDIHILGHLNLAELRDRMSRSHALILPSIEEGLALVQAQAMACGCPIIATENTGAPDLFEHGTAGYILPVRRPDLISDRLQQLADEPETRSRLAAEALSRVQHIGGWSSYGDKALEIYRALLL